MPRTDGLYIREVAVSAIPDGGDVSLQVTNPSGTVLATVPLSVQNGLASIDVPQATTSAWPDDVRFKLVATPAGAQSTTLNVKNSEGGIDFSRIGVVSEPGYSTPSLNGDGAAVTSTSYVVTWNDSNPKPGRRYDTIVDGVDLGTSVIAPVKSKSITLNASGITNIKVYWWDTDEAPLAHLMEINVLVVGNSEYHPLTGFNIVAPYLGYSPPAVDHTPTQTFSSVSALQAQLDSQYDHGGAVYALTGSHTLTSQIEPNVANCIITTDPGSPATLDGGGDRTGVSGSNFGFLLDNCDNTEVSNFNITGMRYHGIAVGREDDEAGGTNNRLLNNNIDYCGTSGVAVRNQADGTLIQGGSISYIGSGDTRGEAIYLGQGNDSNDGNLTNHVTNTTVRGVEIHHTNAEAIDMKRNSAGLLVEYCYLHDIDVKSQGAITCLLDISDAYQANYDADITIRYNYIDSVTTRDFNGDGIVVALGSALIYGNVITRCAGYGVSVYSDFDGPNDDVTIEANIIRNNTAGDIDVNNTNGNGTTSNPAAVTRTKNYVSSGAVGDESTALDFVGPIPGTGIAAFAPNVSVTPPAPSTDEPNSIGSKTLFGALTNIPIDRTGTFDRNEKEASIRFFSRGTRIDDVGVYVVSTTTPNSYSNGDGGIIRFDIEGDNNGAPDGNILRSTFDYIGSPTLFGESQSAAAAAYPGARWADHGETGFRLRAFRRFDLTSPLTINQNQFYHIVMRNVSPDPTNYVSIDLGYWGPGGNYGQNDKRDVDSSWVEGDSDAWAKDSSNNWFKYYDISGCYTIYGDVIQGQPFCEVNNNGTADRTYDLEGSNWARMVYNPPKSGAFCSVGLGLAHRSGTNSVTMRIKQNGSTLHTAVFSGFPTVPSGTNDVDVITATAEFRSLSIPNISVMAGSPVYFEFQPNGVFECPTVQDYSLNNVWAQSKWSGSPNTYAQESSNSGGTWLDWLNNGSRNKIMQMAFYAVEC